MLTAKWANEQEPEVEIWAQNEANRFLNRPAKARWFQIHPRNWNAEKALANGWSGDDYGRPDSHISFLSQCEWPVYQKEVDERIPNSVRYPFEEITERYGRPWVDGGKRAYLTSTSAYMMALALYEHDLAVERGDRDGMISEIRIAGIEMQIGTEYFHQRACFEYWCGMAEGKGIKVVTSPYGTSLLMGPIYARDHHESLHPQSMEGRPLVMLGNMPYVAVTQDEAGNPVGIPQQ